MQHVPRMAPIKRLLSHSSLLQNMYPLKNLDNELKLITKTSLIGAVNTLYMPQSTLILLSEKQTIMLSLGNISRLSIMSYL